MQSLTSNCLPRNGTSNTHQLASLGADLAPHIIPFFAFPPEIRKAIYTTNAIESMNSSLRKVIKSQQIFPSDDAAFKLVYLAMRNICKKWTMPIKDWEPALNLFEDRLHL
jgi:transposase-like protein